MRGPVPSRLQPAPSPTATAAAAAAAAHYNKHVLAAASRSPVLSAAAPQSPRSHRVQGPGGGGSTSQTMGSPPPGGASLAPGRGVAIAPLANVRYAAAQGQGVSGGVGGAPGYVQAGGAGGRARGVGVAVGAGSPLEALLLGGRRAGGTSIDYSTGRSVVVGGGGNSGVRALGSNSYFGTGMGAVASSSVLPPVRDMRVGAGGLLSSSTLPIKTNPYGMGAGNGGGFSQTQLLAPLRRAPAVEPYAASRLFGNAGGATLGVGGGGAGRASYFVGVVGEWQRPGWGWECAGGDGGGRVISGRGHGRRRWRWRKQRRRRRRSARSV